LDPRPRQPYILIPELKVLYIRVPKAASNSLKHWFEALGHNPEIVHNRPLPVLGAQRYTTISFVRNPYTRISSAWRDKVERGGHSLGGLGDGRPSFAEFVDRLAHVDMVTVNPHVRPQSLLLKTNPDFLGGVETLQADLDRLALQLGVESVGVSRRNSTKGTAPISTLSDETRARVAELYADDFARFGYPIDPTVGVADN